MPHHPRKHFGQNFLVDNNVIRKIISTIDPKENDNIVEIGPGYGALTKELLPRLKKLTVVELDRDLIPFLKANCDTLGTLNIHQHDALSFDYKTLYTENRKLRVIGNLPYNISTPLIFHLLRFNTIIEDMIFMLQKEVVQRICAPPGTKTHGRLSIMVQAHCEVAHLFDVSPNSFNPPPKVNSSIVRLVPTDKYLKKIENFQHFETIVKAAFSQRRKTIHNTLKEHVSTDAWNTLEIDPQLRAEALTLESFITISNFASQNLA